MTPDNRHAEEILYVNYYVGWLTRDHRNWKRRWKRVSSQATRLIKLGFTDEQLRTARTRAHEIVERCNQ